MKESLVVANTWAALRRLTPARIALGRAGSGLPTTELLRFGLAHARARDAVHAALDAEALARRLAELGLSPTIVKSAAMNRETYLRRPDLGRRLAPDADISNSDRPFGLVIGRRPLRPRSGAPRGAPRPRAHRSVAPALGGRELRTSSRTTRTAP